MILSNDHRNLLTTLARFGILIGKGKMKNILKRKFKSGHHAYFASCLLWLNTLPIFYWFIFHPVQPWLNRLNQLNHDRKVSLVQFSVLVLEHWSVVSIINSPCDWRSNTRRAIFYHPSFKTRMKASSLLWFTTTTTMKPFHIRWDWYIDRLLLESKSTLDWWISNFWPDVIQNQNKCLQGW